MPLLISWFNLQWTTIGLLTGLTITVWYFIQKYKNNMPPGPWGFPVLGYLPFLGSQPQEKFMQLRKTYGDIFTIQMGSFIAVVLNGREKIKEALITHAGIFDTRPGFFTFSILNERLAFGLYNDRWIVFKKIVVNRLNAIINSKTYTLDKLLTDEAAKFVKDITKHNGKPFDPTMDLNVTFCSVIYQISYGKGENIREDNDFLEMLAHENDFIDFSTSGNPAEVMPWLSKIFPSLVKPLYDIIEYHQYLREKKLREHKETFSKENIRDLADSLIDLIDETIEMKSVGLTFNHLKKCIDEIIPAAFDTTATAMRWILMCLIKFPHVQRKLIQEIDSVLGERDPSIIDRQSMPYTEAVILETLRFKAPIPLSVPHAAVKDAKLSGYDIPKDTPILLNLHSLARDFSVWDFPNSFYPEHFLTVDGALDRDKVTFMSPFSLGKRKCIGEQLARHGMFITLVSMIQRFKILPVEGEEYDMVGINKLTDCPKPYKIIAEVR